MQPVMLPYNLVQVLCMSAGSPSYNGGGRLTLILQTNICHMDTLSWIKQNLSKINLC